MKKILSIVTAFAVVFAFAACNKVNPDNKETTDPDDPTKTEDPTGDDNPTGDDPTPKEDEDPDTFSIVGVIGDYKLAENQEVPAGAPAAVWADNCTVHVYKGATYLGFLTASPVSGNPKQAKLSGDIGDPVGEDLFFVYSPAIMVDMDSYFVGQIVTSVSADLLTQDGTAPIVVYGLANYTTDQKRLTIDFNFASAAVWAHITGLPASSDISSISIGPVNTHCNMSLSDAGIGGSDYKSISIPSPGRTDGQGRVDMAISVPVSLRAEQRTVNVEVGGQTYSGEISREEIDRGYLYEYTVEVK